MISTYTDCPVCGRAVLAASPADANESARECFECWKASEPAEDGSDDGLCTRFYPSVEGAAE